MAHRRVAIVTGSNKGIGLETVRLLCQQFDGDVFLTARDVKRGLAAVQHLEKDNLKPKFHQLDHDSDSSVAALRDFIKDKYGGLEVLINNAAISWDDDTDDPLSVQAEVTINTNYFGPLRVCQNLFPLLRPHARVVNVSSQLGLLTRIPGADLRTKFASPNLTLEELSGLMNQFVKQVKDGTYLEHGWPSPSSLYVAYTVSKVGVTALSFLQQRQFDKDSREDIIVNAVHPGHVDTDLSGHTGPLKPIEGAVGPVYCALLPHGCSKPKGDLVYYDKSIVDWFTHVFEF